MREPDGFGLGLNQLSVRPISLESQENEGK